MNCNINIQSSVYSTSGLNIHFKYSRYLDLFRDIQGHGKGGADTAAFINTTESVRELRLQATPRGRRLYQPQVSNQEPLDLETSA